MRRYPPTLGHSIDRRAKMKNEINSLHERITAQEHYKIFDKYVRRSIRDDFREHTNELAKKAEDAAAMKNIKDLYKITRQLLVLLPLTPSLSRPRTVGF